MKSILLAPLLFHLLAPTLAQAALRDPTRPLLLNPAHSRSVTQKPAVPTPQLSQSPLVLLSLYILTRLRGRLVSREEVFGDVFG